MAKTPNRDQIVTYLDKYEMRPIHSLGQNFLIDDSIAQTIVGHANINETSRVIEIGPGFGALTAHLADRCQTLDLFELDNKMCLFLADHYGSKANIAVHHLDGLKADFRKYDTVISNLPYYLTTPFIEKTYRESDTLELAVFMIQKDTLPRLIAAPGADGYGPLAIMLSYFADVNMLLEVAPKAFYPEPPVDSCVISIVFKNGIDRQFAKVLDKLVRSLFLSRRKTIANNLANYLRSKEQALEYLRKAAVDPSMRPEQVSLEQYCELAKQLIA